jgi:hypothetical protein
MKATSSERERCGIDLDVIGRIMHESWAQTKRAQGFHGPSDMCDATTYSNGGSFKLCNVLDNYRCAKYHADLIPWENLPEKQKDINRHAFDAVLPYVASTLSHSQDESAKPIDTAEYEMTIQSAIAYLHTPEALNAKQLERNLNDILRFLDHTIYTAPPESEVTGKLVEALEKIAATTCGCHHSADPDWHSDRCVVRIARAVLADAQVKERRDGK